MKVTLLQTAQSVDVPPGHGVHFGRGLPDGHDVTVELLVDNPSASAVAGAIWNQGNCATVQSFQYHRAGAVQVVRVDGETVGSLPGLSEHGAGGAYTLPDDHFAVRLYAGDHSVLFDVRREDPEPSVDLPLIGKQRSRSGTTTASWTAERVLKPGPGDEWQTVVAIAVAHTRYQARAAVRRAMDAAVKAGSDSSQVRLSNEVAAALWRSHDTTNQAVERACGKFFGRRTGNGWLTARLDAGLRTCGLTPDRKDKLPLLIAVVTGAQCIPDDILDHLERALWAPLPEPEAAL